MVNPYEPPQTIDRPLPLAQEVVPPAPSSPPTKEDLIAALRRFSDAGWIVAFSALGCIVTALIVQYSQSTRGFRHHMLQSILIVCAATTAVTFIWGFFKNLFAYDRVIKQSTDQVFQHLYWTCQLHGWIRLGGGVLAALLMPAISPRQPSERNFEIALCALAAASLIHTVILHHQAFRWWGNRLGMRISPRVRQLFLVAGISGAILLFCGAEYYIENRDEIVPWFTILTAAVIGIAGIVYAWVYRHLAKVLASSSWVPSAEAK